MQRQDETEINEVTNLQIYALYELVNEFKDSIEVMNFEPYEKTTVNGGDFTYVKIPNTNIRVGITMSKYPQICLFQDTSLDKVTEIFLSRFTSRISMSQR